MTSASLARKCIKVVSPLIDMIVDDDEQHTGQLKYGDDIKTVKQARDYLTKVLQDATDACAELKSGLDSLEGKLKKVDRNTEEGILIHMTLQAIRLLPDEIARLGKLNDSDDVDRFFPADMKNDRVLALQKLIKKHNGDADAESVVSLSESAYPSKSVAITVSEPVASEPAAASESSASSEPVVSAESASPIASESSVESPVASAESTSPVVSAESASPVASESSVAESPADDASISLMEEASEMLEEPIEAKVEKVAAVDYTGMSRDDLMAEKKRFKTHKQKDEFIQNLINALTGGAPAVEKEVFTEKVAEKVPAGAFVVEDVSKFKRSKDGVEQVLVKWKDYPVEQMTWENKTDELSRSNVGGSFFQPSDTSYKKFCERVGLSTGKETCAAIETKDEEDCKKRNEKKSPDEKQEDCSTTSVVLIDAEEEEPEVVDDSEPKSDDSSASAAATAASISAAAASSSPAKEEEEEEEEEAATEAATVESADEGESIVEAVEETLSE